MTPWERKPHPRPSGRPAGDDKAAQGAFQVFTARHGVSWARGASRSEFGFASPEPQSCFRPGEHPLGNETRLPPVGDPKTRMRRMARHGQAPPFRPFGFSRHETRLLRPFGSPWVREGWRHKKLPSGPLPPPASSPWFTIVRQRCGAAWGGFLGGTGGTGRPEPLLQQRFGFSRNLTRAAPPKTAVRAAAPAVESRVPVSRLPGIAHDCPAWLPPGHCGPRWPPKLHDDPGICRVSCPPVTVSLPAMARDCP